MTTADDNTAARLRLSLIHGLGPATQHHLVLRFGTAQAVLRAGFEELAGFAGLPVAQALAIGADAKLVERTLRWAEAPGRYLLCPEDPSYPPLLREVGDAPGVLYALGRVDLLHGPALAIVGSRNATPQGERDAQALAHQLSEAGLCIASGLALGIDSAAHRGGLQGRSSSIAVMGTGADILYPQPNRGLAQELAGRGCIVTEFPLGTPPASWNFPRRNRLISGLARGVLVVQANQRSGSLGTARCALEQNRDVFAIPGSIHSPLSRGCHKLIKEGAKLVENAADVLLELGLPCAATAVERAEGRGRAHDSLLEAMGFDPVSPDQIAQRTGLAAGAIAARLSRLELDGSIEPIGGGRFQRSGRTR